MAGDTTDNYYPRQEANPEAFRENFPEVYNDKEGARKEIERLQNEIDFISYIMSKRYKSKEEAEWQWFIKTIGRRRRLARLIVEKKHIDWHKDFYDGKTKELDLTKAKQVPVDKVYNGELRDTGNRLTGKCPFHNENTASFMIYKDSNTYHCFGCGSGGDVIDFIMELYDYDFMKAVNYLNNL